MDLPMSGGDAKQISSAILRFSFLFFLFIAYWSFGAETCYSIGAGLMVLPLLMLILTKVDIPQQVDNKKTSEDKKTN